MIRYTNSTIAVIFTALLVTPLLLTAQADPAAAGEKLSREITPLTKEQLTTKVPHFYCFMYRANPQPGKRYWLRVSNTRWIERYPNGIESTFKVLGHTTIKDTEGTLVVKVSGDEAQTETANDGGLQAFIPDKGSSRMHHWYRNSARGDSDWNDLGQMRSVE